jgi:hypothetical protein
MLTPLMATAALLTASSDGVPGACKTSAIPTTITEREFTAPSWSPRFSQRAPEVVFRFRKRDDPLRATTFAFEDPTMGVALLRDGSGLQFVRDCSGVRCIYSGLSRTADASACWDWLADWSSPTSATGIVEINAETQLSLGTNTKAGELLLRRRTKEGWNDEVLLTGRERIIGVGVSPPLHGQYYDVHIIRRLSDGSISLTAYGLTPFKQGF